MLQITANSHGGREYLVPWPLLVDRSVLSCGGFLNTYDFLVQYYRTLDLFILCSA